MSSAAIQKYQYDCTGSRISLFRDVLAGMLGSKEWTRALSSPSLLLDIRSECSDANAMQVICNHKSTQEVRARADREVLVESGVGETPLHGLKEMKALLDSLTWLKMIWRELENQLILQTDRLASTQAYLTSSTFSQLAKLASPNQPSFLAFHSPILDYHLRRLTHSSIPTRPIQHWQSRSPFKLKLQPPTHKQAIGLCMLHPPGSPPFTLQITLNICSWIASAIENDSTGLPSITIAQTTLTANAAVVVSYYPDENLIRTLSDNGRRNHCFGMLLDCHGPLPIRRSHIESRRWSPHGKMGAPALKISLAVAHFSFHDQAGDRDLDPFRANENAVAWRQLESAPQVLSLRALLACPRIKKVKLSGYGSIPSATCWSAWTETPAVITLLRRKMIHEVLQAPKDFGGVTDVTCYDISWLSSNDPTPRPPIETIVEDDTGYSGKQMSSLLKDTRGWSQGIWCARHALSLASQFTTGWYEIIISVVELLGGHRLHCCEYPEATLVPYNHKIERPAEEQRLVNMFKQVDMSKDFYFRILPPLASVGPWLLPPIHGHVDLASIFATLIARWSRHNTRARYLSHGVNEEETTSMAPRPTIENPFYVAASRRFDDLFARYGASITILNLIKRRELQSRVSKLLDDYTQCGNHSSSCRDIAYSPFLAHSTHPAYHPHISGKLFARLMAAWSLSLDRHISSVSARVIQEGSKHEVLKSNRWSSIISCVCQEVVTSVEE
ncbi:hypothetical protein F4604DRAFT_1689126 [Suillus subluteus]|nr:hypothetical protein F4604DRAFT_1689126 [Suillus subluteus]